MDQIIPAINLIVSSLMDVCCLALIVSSVDSDLLHVFSAPLNFCFFFFLHTFPSFCLFFSHLLKIRSLPAFTQNHKTRLRLRLRPLLASAARLLSSPCVAVVAGPSAPSVPDDITDDVTLHSDQSSKPTGKDSVQGKQSKTVVLLHFCMSYIH